MSSAKTSLQTHDTAYCSTRMAHLLCYGWYVTVWSANVLAILALMILFSLHSPHTSVFIVDINHGFIFLLCEPGTTGQVRTTSAMGKCCTVNSIYTLILSWCTSARTNEPSVYTTAALDRAYNIRRYSTIQSQQVSSLTSGPRLSKYNDFGTSFYTNRCILRELTTAPTKQGSKLVLESACWRHHHQRRQPTDCYYYYCTSYPNLQMSTTRWSILQMSVKA